MGINRKPTPLLSLRNVVLFLTFAHLARKIYLNARNDVLLRFLLGLETKKSKYDFKHGGELFAREFASHGSRFLFTTLKNPAHPLLTSCKEAQIQVVVVETESTAIHAADIVFRVTKKPAVVFIPDADGLFGCLDAIFNCKKAQSSILILSESVPVLMQGRGMRQEANQKELAAPFVKWASVVNSVREINTTTEEAFLRAFEDVHGPVLLEVKRDVFFPQNQMIEEYKSLTKNIPGNVSKLQSLILSFRLANIYATNSFLVRPPKPLRVFPLRPSEFLLRKTFRVLERSARPLLLIGGKTIPEYSQVEQIQSSLVNLGIPVFLYGDAKGMLGDESPLVCHRGLEAGLKESDLVIFVGMENDYRVGFGELISDTTFTISANTNKVDVMLNRRPTLSIIADPFLFLKELGSQNRFKQPLSTKWIDWGKRLHTFSLAESRLLTTRQDTMTSNILLSLKSLPNNTHIIANGESVEKYAYLFHPKYPFGWLEPGPFGCQGVATGFALASKLLFEDRDVWILDSSISSARILSEVMTFLERRWPVAYVVFRPSEQRASSSLCVPDAHRSNISLLSVTEDSEVLTQIKLAQKELSHGKVVIVEYFC